MKLWLDFVTVTTGPLSNQHVHFSCLGGFLKLYTNFIGFFKERKKHTYFSTKEKNFKCLCDNIKLQSFWWLKAI